MELSLFSRDTIALAAGVAMSHNCFDAAVYLGVCDKIVPGLIIAAATFGHVPTVFVPAGPMVSGLPNDEKAKVRQQFAKGEIGREELMKAEMASYHGPGTCTFYGTANTNQMLMEFMGLHLPGASFVNPGTPLREALTTASAQRALEITALGNDYRPAGQVLDERAFVNGMVGLMATGGSTNLVLHLPAMARAAGIHLTLEDFADISANVPLMAKVYPNGLADVNHFHAAGGLGFMIGELLDAGLLHDDVCTVAGDGLKRYAQEPKLRDGALVWEDGAGETLNDKILRPLSDPFQKSGGLAQLSGNLGQGVIKVSAVDPSRHVIEAPVRIFHDQVDVKTAFQAGQITEDTIVVVRFQGPAANGMPELHSLTPILSVLQDRGLKVALVTDGRMSGASGKCPPRFMWHPKRPRAARWQSCAMATACGLTRQRAGWTFWSPISTAARLSPSTFRPMITASGANCSKCSAPMWGIPPKGQGSSSDPFILAKISRGCRTEGAAGAAPPNQKPWVAPPNLRGPASSVPRFPRSRECGLRLTGGSSSKRAVHRPPPSARSACETAIFAVPFPARPLASGQRHRRLPYTRHCG